MSRDPPELGSGRLMRRDRIRQRVLVILALVVFVAYVAANLIGMFQ